MVRRVLGIFLSCAVAFACSFSMAAADTQHTIKLESDNTTVQNRLPNIRIYCETTEKYDAENTTLEIDGYPADVTSAEAFSKTGEGMNYFIMIDVSSSIDKGEFKEIKESIVNFAQNSLSSRDTVFLIPFGEKVYYDESNGAYSADSKEFAKAIKNLKADDRYTNLYDAVDKVAGFIDTEQDRKLKRSAVLLFTDGKDDTSGGLKGETEAPEALKAQGSPLYTFVVDGNKNTKDSLGQLSRELNGRLYVGDPAENLKRLKDGIDNTLTIEAEAMNSADIGSEFDAVVTVEGVEKSIEKSGVVANRSGEQKNSLMYTITKLLESYWWVLVLVVIALIALIVMMRIKRHKGIVKVDGETVFRDSVTQKQHITVNKNDILCVKMEISVDGSNVISRDVEISKSIIVGRSDICDIYFDDPTMARQNFCIEMNGGQLFISDLESTNGTILNSVKLTSTRELHSGDEITAGKTRIRVYW